MALRASYLRHSYPTAVVPHLRALPVRPMRRWIWKQRGCHDASAASLLVQLNGPCTPAAAAAARMYYAAMAPRLRAELAQKHLGTLEPVFEKPSTSQADL